MWDWSELNRVNEGLVQNDTYTVATSSLFLIFYEKTKQVKTIIVAIQR